MKKTKGKVKEHPEVKDIKNICTTTPDSKNTKDVCNKVNQDKSHPAK